MKRTPLLHSFGFAGLLGLASFASFASVACGPDAPVPKPPMAETPVLPPCPTAAPSATDTATTSFEGLPVARVCLVGGTDASRTAAQRLDLLHDGDVLTAARVRADLDNLMKLGPYDDATAYGIAKQTGAGGVMLVYAVRERPIVADFGIEGAKAMVEAKVMLKQSIEPGNRYDPRLASALASSIREFYLARGYDAVRVVVVTEPANATPGVLATQIHVRIKVDEGVQWHLAKLDVRGNKKVSEADIRKALKLNVGEAFVDELVDKANTELASLLFDRGFVTMHLDFQRGKVDDQGNVALTVVVNEGEVHTLRALHVAGLGAPLEKELLERVIHARPKQVFSRSALFEDVARVKEFFKQRGQTVNVIPQTEIDPKDHSVVLTLDVEG